MNFNEVINTCVKKYYRQRQSFIRAIKINRRRF